SIPVYPIVRPRGGDFLYTENEFETMKKDVLLCKQLGFEGVVVGLLHTDGSIDITRTTQLVNIAWPMGVTFHRAFDRAANLFTALEAVIETGCERILTSGGVPDAPAGAETIKKLVQEAGHRIIIMPGSGVRAANLEQLVQATGAVEFHSSAKTAISSAMQHRNENFPGNDGGYDGVNEQEIQQMCSLLNPVGQ
ncbi:MAG: copper homeostasis protein CutC, partial [Dinghuibacter sp.]|nr:copper homeostasis protein CutC [Dinghuibacter sp.]